MLGLVAVAIWAFRPLEEMHGAALLASEDLGLLLESEVGTTGRGPATVRPRHPLDLTGFSKPLWLSIPTPSELSTPVGEPLERLPVELIGIVDQGGERLAALYDQREGRLLLLKHGESLSGFDVEIGAGLVALVRGGERMELPLEAQ